MRSSLFGKWRLSVGIAIGLVGAALAIPAIVAALTAGGGGAVTSVQFRAETALNVYKATALSPLPGASITVNVPANQTRLILARYSAVSRCVGASNAACALAIVVDATPIMPSAKFDAPAPNDNFENHEVNRAVRVGAGSHLVRVYRQVNPANTEFDLAAWNFEVQVSQ